MKFIDTHCHPYLIKTKSEDEVITNFTVAGWAFFISIWVDIKTSKQSLELANRYDFAKTTVWVHPCDVYDLDLTKSINNLEKLYLENKNKVVAIWETGLDYYWMKKDAEKLTENIQDEEKKDQLKQKHIQEKKDIQKAFFIAQIALAKNYHLPLIIHNREAKEDVLEILKQENYQNFIMHCFAEDLDFANKCIDFAPDCMISFSGIVTFKNAKAIQETAKNIPLKNIIIETDSPYLTPTPYRGKEENELSFTQHVLKKIQDLREESPESIENQIFENSKKIFKIS